MRWIDTLESAAAEKLPETAHRYFRQGSADGTSAVLEEHQDGWTVQTADLPLRLTG